MPMPTENMPNFTHGERLKTPKTDCALEVYFQVCRPREYMAACHLNVGIVSHFTTVDALDTVESGYPRYRRACSEYFEYGGIRAMFVHFADWYKVCPYLE